MLFPFYVYLFKDMFLLKLGYIDQWKHYTMIFHMTWSHRDTNHQSLHYQPSKYDHWAMMIDPQYLTTTNDFKPLFVHISLSIYLLYDFYIQHSEENKLHIITYGISPNFFFKSFVFFIVHLSDLGEVLQYH